MSKIYFSPSRLFLIFNLALIVAIFIMGLRSGVFQKEIDANDLASRNGKYVVFTGRVCEEADRDYKSQRLTVCAAGKTLVTAAMYPKYDYGDYLKITGRLQAPGKVEDFDYGSYLARYDIYSVMYYPKIEKLSGWLNFGQGIYKILINFKQKLKSIIDSSLPEPEAGLANAVLLGYKRTVIREDLDIFSRVGLSHMIAISGSHITILSAMLVNFLLTIGFNRRRALWVVFAFLLIYPLITGLSASAVRSSIMGGLAFMALYYGRAGAIVNALFFSGAIMLAFNPQILRADIGFQLSFLAVLGIIYIYPLGEKLYNGFLERLASHSRAQKILKNILDTVNLTLVSQIMTMPILLINFKQLSLISPMANIAVLWTFPLLLSSIIMSLFVSLLFPAVLWPIVGPWLFLPSYLLLKFIFVVCDLLAKPEWAAINISAFTWKQGIVYYLCLFIIVFIAQKIAKRRMNRNREITF